LPPRAEVEVFNLIQGFIEILVQKDSVELRGYGNFLLVATDAILAVRAPPLEDPRRRGCRRCRLDKNANGVWKPLPKSEGTATCEDESPIARPSQDGTWNPVTLGVGFSALNQDAGAIHLSEPLWGDEVIIFT
jgi:hypothetical protein